MSLRGRGSKIRRLAAAGQTPEEIADLYGVDPAAVALLIKTPVGETWRNRPPPPRKTPTDRRILSWTATRVRELVDRGWNAPQIAEELDLDVKRVREFVRRLKPVRGEQLSQPRTRPEQAQVERNRRKARARAKAAAAAKAARWVDPWKTAATEDERYRDPIAPPPLVPEPEPPAAVIESAELAEVQAPEPEPALTERPAFKADEWSQWWVRGEDHGAAKLTVDQVRSIRGAHAAGRGLKELASTYGVHRQTIWNIVAGRTWTHI